MNLDFIFEKEKAEKLNECKLEIGRKPKFKTKDRFTKSLNFLAHNILKRESVCIRFKTSKEKELETVFYVACLSSRICQSNFCIK